MIRVDFNVPQDKKDPSIITNTQRIDGALPTNKYCLAQGARSVVLMSHLGRPDGRVVEKFSLLPVAKILAEKLGRAVSFQGDCIGPAVEKACEAPDPGAVILLENLRFHVAEEGKGEDAGGAKVKATLEETRVFRTSLAKLGDVYVNDAFGTAHRAHSSMVGEGFAERCSGFLVSKELDAFAQVLDAPKRPLLAIIGGAKVSDKILLLKNLVGKVDELIVGGGMAFTFLKAIPGMRLGASLADAPGAAVGPEIVALAEKSGTKLILPVDFKWSTKFGDDGDTGTATAEGGIPDGCMGLDCGPQTALLNKQAIARARTIIWNGPMGVFELQPFEAGTKAMMDDVVAATVLGAVTVIGGGDTATCCKVWHGDKVTHVSTGGGASSSFSRARNSLASPL